MFPRPNAYKFDFQNQLPFFIAGQRMQNHNIQRHFMPGHQYGFGFQGNMINPMGQPRAFVMSPQRQIIPFMDPPFINRRVKRRHALNSEMHHGKRARLGGNQESEFKESNWSQLSTRNLGAQPDSKEKFVVPVSKGTEDITVSIWSYFLSSQMTDDDLKRKLHLRQSLHTVAQGAFPNCRLFIVGSSMTGFATKTSDVDMCLMITDKEIDQKGHATKILSSILKALQQCSFMQHPQVIRAKVPILKFFDRISSVECDLNINNTIGVRNTHLLRYYAYIDWRVRPLVLFVKRWARFHDINDASKKTISSYSLSLMLIHYLQIGVTPPVLPCLQKLRPDLFNINADVRKLSLSLDDSVDFASTNIATLGELFIGFLNYYTNIFKYNTEAISVRLGKTLSIRDVTRCNESSQWMFLCIEEPFERSNTARSVFDYNVFLRIMRVFKTSFITLQQSRKADSILSRPF